MTRKGYLTSAIISGIFSWSALILVLKKLNPFETTEIALLLFFLSFFFACASTFTIVGYSLRKWLFKEELPIYKLNTSLRQAVLITLCITGALILLLLDVLTWWAGFLLVIMMVLIELYFTSKGTS